MFVFASPADSWTEFDRLVALAEEILQDLKIPYQTSLMCTGDLSAPNAKRIDLEAWMPGLINMAR